MAGSGGKRKIGRNKVKCVAYRACGRRTVNKIKRVERCNGPAALLAYRSTLK